MKTYKINQIDFKRILGRNTVDAGTSDKPLALFWGAAALELNVKAKEVWVKLSSNYDSNAPWVAVFVNGMQVGRFVVPKGNEQWVCVAFNMNPQKENLVSIIKDTQPMPDEPHHSLFIHEVGLSDEGEFCPLMPRKMNIEFIGDSITSGEGLAGNPQEMDWITQWFCASKSYAVQASAALNANWWVMSQCGWGICWGWDGNIHLELPSHYEDVCSIMKGDYQNDLGVAQKYDFKEKMDYVVLNLGTNDNGAFFQQPWKDENGVEHVLHRKENDVACEEDGNIVKNKVVDFLKVLREKNPQAKIIWTWGMIKLKTIQPYIQAGIEEYKKLTGDTGVYSMELDSMEDVEVLTEDKGSRGHPGPKTHKLAAQKIANFIEKLDSEN